MMVGVLITVVAWLVPWHASSGAERQAAADCISPHLQHGSHVALERRRELQLDNFLVEVPLGFLSTHHEPYLHGACLHPEH